MSCSDREYAAMMGQREFERRYGQPLSGEAMKAIRERVTVGATLAIARCYSSAVVSPGIRAAMRDVNANLRRP